MLTSLQDVSNTAHIPMQEVRSAVAETQMNAPVITLTLSERVHVCVASVVACSFVMTAGRLQNKFKHRLMLHAPAMQRSSLNLCGRLARLCSLNN